MEKEVKIKEKIVKINSQKFSATEKRKTKLRRKK